MYTAEALADIHGRSHSTLSKILAHGAGLGPGLADRPLEGFSYPTVRLQVHHVLGAERYWIGVLHGRLVGDDDEAAFPTLETLSALQGEVAAATREYILGAGAEELNAPRAMTTWGGHERTLVPALILVRVSTHVYQHGGQLLAMCRILGSPGQGWDFPIV